MSEKGGWSESTWRMRSQRSSKSTLKLDTPIARTLPASTSSTITRQDSSTGVPMLSGQWNWYRSIRSTPSRRSDASHSARIESGVSIRRGSALRSRSSHTMPHLVKIRGRPSDGMLRSSRPTTSSE